MQELARPEHIPALKRIWAASFPGDSEALIDDALTRLFRPGNCLVHTEEGTPVSMTLMLPARYHSGAAIYDVQYIYAAATLPAYRGRGVFGALLRRAHELARERGQAASFLRPGEPSLSAYYRRFGYRDWFRAQRLRRTPREMLTGGPARGIRVADVCPSYGSLRARLLDGYPSWIDWADELAQQAVVPAVRSGGGVLLGPDGCALCERDGETLLVRELLCPPGRLDDYCAAIARAYAAQAYEILRPVTAGEAGEAFAMWLPFTTEAERRVGTPYLGLSLE